MAETPSGQLGKRSGGPMETGSLHRALHQGDGKASERGNFYFPSLRLAIPSPDYVHRETKRAEPARAAGFLRFSWRFHLERKDTHENLALVFKTNSKSTMTITLANPRDNVTLDEVKAAAAKMIPVLVTSAGQM